MARSKHASPPEPLTWGQVNLWRLRGQFLSDRQPPSRLVEINSRLCGLHAQVMSSAEMSAGARLHNGGPDDVRAALWEKRTLVKTWSMRGTLHLISAREMPLYVQALRTRRAYRSEVWLKYFNITLEEIDALIEGVRRALDGHCLTRLELASEVARITGKPTLAERLRSGWGEFLKPAAFEGHLCFGPSQGQSVTFVRPDQWLDMAGEWPEPDEAQSESAVLQLARRYLAVYGPATRDDFARWFGVQPAQVRSTFHDLSAELVMVDVEGYRALALRDTLADIRREEGDVPLVRLLGGFDPYTVDISPQHTYLLPEGTRPRVFRTAGWVSPVLTVDGFVRGVWNYQKARSGLSLTLEAFGPLDATVKSGIDAEIERLGAMLGGPVDLKYGDVQFGGKRNGNG